MLKGFPPFWGGLLAGVALAVVIANVVFTRPLISFLADGIIVAVVLVAAIAYHFVRVRSGES